MHSEDGSRQLTGSMVSLDEAVAIFASDLPLLCDAELARLLVEGRRLDTLPIAPLLVALARSELARRRASRSPSSD